MTDVARMTGSIVRTPDVTAESDLPLARVALVTGYSDQSHLSRSLRRLLGCTPAQVRRRRGRIVQVASIQDSSHSAP